MARLLLKGNPVRVSTTTLLALATASAAALGGFSGCAGEPQTFQPDATTSANATGATSGGGGGDGDGGSSASGEGASTGEGAGPAENRGPELFAELEADMMSACGVCHDAGGTSNTPFLAGPDRYQTISSWPEVIKEDWESSILLTYPVSGGGHSGINLDSSAYVDTLYPAVQEWLEEEARGIVQGGEGGGGSGVGGEGGGEEPMPSIDPFKPIIGFNAVYLHPLDEAFTGMAITFTATELTPTSLELTNLEVHTTSELGLHIVHPLFVVFPVGDEPDPDPVDSFSNVDAYHDPGTGDPMGPGTLVLTNWSAGAKLSIAFETIEAHDPGMGEGGGGTGVGMCEAQADFDAVAGQFGPCAGQCHNGQNAGATGAVDMRDLDNDTGLACIQIRNRVNLDNPAQSQIFIVTDPNGGAGHPFKFGNNQTNWQNFRNAVTAWIEAEAAASN